MARARYRRVRTPEGARRYGVPIGSIIRVGPDRPDKAKGSEDRSSKAAAEDDEPTSGGSTPPPPKDPPATPPVGPDDDDEDDGTDDVDPASTIDDIMDLLGPSIAPASPAATSADSEAWKDRYRSILEDTSDRSDEATAVLPTSLVARYAEYDREDTGGEELDILTEIIERDGIRSPLRISTDGRTAILHEGNHRLAAAQRLGIEEVPVHITLDEEVRANEGTPVPVDDELMNVLRQHESELTDFYGSAPRVSLPAPETTPEVDEARRMDRVDGEEWAAEHWPFTPDNHPFTDTEIAAIRGYTEVEFDRWNADLRGGLEQTRSVDGIRQLDSAIARAPAVPEPVIVSRMVGDAAFSDVADDFMRGLSDADLDAINDSPNREREYRRRLGEHMIGAERTEPAFMSTSVQADGMTDAGYVLRLTVPEGTRGVYVSNPDGPISAAMRQENELILGRGVRYRIDRVEVSEGSDAVELHATVIGQDSESIDSILAANQRRSRSAPAYRGDPGDESNSAALFDELHEARDAGLERDVAEIEDELRALPPAEHMRGQLTRENRISLERAVRRKDMTEDEAVAIANGGLTQFLEDRDVAISMTPQALTAVLESGRFLTQHDEGALLNGAASFEPDSRRLHEQAWFGPHGIAPVYGYIRDRGGAPSGADVYGQNRDGTGGLSVVLHESVRERSTVSAGDSLALPREVFPGPLDEPGRFSGRPGLAARVATTPEEYAAFLAAGTEPQDENGIGGTGYYRNQYVEAQIHGGVEVTDIAQVVFNDENPPAALIAMLEAREIPWTIRPQDFDNEAGHDEALRARIARIMGTEEGR